MSDTEVPIEHVHKTKSGDKKKKRRSKKSKSRIGEETQIVFSDLSAEAVAVQRGIDQWAQSEPTPQKFGTNDLQAFSALSEFVEFLVEQFGNKAKASPLLLYQRLLSHVTLTDKVAMSKFLNGFRTFTSEFDLVKDSLLDMPRGTTIVVVGSVRVYIDIQNFVHRARTNSELLRVIHQHLLTISAILDPNQEKVAQLVNMEETLKEMNIDSNTNEGEFITNIMGKAQGAMANIDAENPAAAMMGLMNSGIIQDMMAAGEFSAQ